MLAAQILLHETSKILYFSGKKRARRFYLRYDTTVFNLLNCCTYKTVKVRVKIRLIKSAFVLCREHDYSFAVALK